MRYDKLCLLILKPEGKEASDDLLFVNITTMDNLKCNKTLFGAVTDINLCAGNEEKTQCNVSSIRYSTIYL